MPTFPRPRPPASIRARLILLVRAVWVPAAAGLALQAGAIYRQEDAGARAATGAMTRAEAQRIAKAVAMVPEMRTIIRSLQDGLAEADADDARA